MNYWLLKTEPETFSWDTLVAKGNSMWDGVRNFQARNNLRKMAVGDLVFIYHSGKSRAIVGIAEVTKEHYPDPTATEGNWSAVDVKAVRKLNREVSLQEIKYIEALHTMSLVKFSRLSVQSLTDLEFNFILSLENEK